jgi:hypothetical protein
VPVLGGMGLEPDAIGEFFIAMLPVEVQGDCVAILEREEVPPYGELVDEHHGPCWRAYHVGAVADADGDGSSALTRRAEVTRPDAAADYERLAGPRLPRFWRPRDDTSSALHR